MSSTTEQLLSQLRSLVPLGTQVPSEANIKQAQDTLRKLKVSGRATATMTMMAATASACHSEVRLFRVRPQILRADRIFFSLLDLSLCCFASLAQLDLVKLHSSPPLNADEVTLARKVLLWQRETLELACFLSLYSRDVAAFERYMAQLKTYYNDYRAVLAPSPSQGPVLGMYLLCLLSQNQIADFHTEYELLAHAATSAPASSAAAAASSSLPPASPTSSRAVSSSALLSSPFIAYPVALEQQLMEGCYHQILSAKKDAPLQIYALFTDTLAETVRAKIADCSEQAYESLPLAEIQKMLLMPEPDDTINFVQARKGWLLQGTKVLFANKQAQANTEINALKTIKQTLEYATELDRII